MINIKTKNDDNTIIYIIYVFCINKCLIFNDIYWIAFDDSKSWG